MNDAERETEPGFVLKAYEKAKTKIAGLADKGKAEAKSLMSGGEKDDPLTAGNSWEEGKTPVETTEAEENRSQEEMDETFGSGDDRNRDARTDLPDGSGTAVMQGGGAAPESEDDDAPRLSEEADTDGPIDDGGKRGAVELAASDVHASIGTDDNPAAPDMSTLDQVALARMAEDEAGDVPSQGLGLDDGPRVTYPGDVRN